MTMANRQTPIRPLFYSFYICIMSGVDKQCPCCLANPKFVLKLIHFRLSEYAPWVSSVLRTGSEE